MINGFSRERDSGYESGRAGERENLLIRKTDDMWCGAWRRRYAAGR